MKTKTPKQNVQLAEPTARCDFYELLRAQGLPCWFIRIGQHGPALSSICKSPRAAWADAYAGLLKAIRERAGAA